MATLPSSSFQGPLAPKIGLNDSFRSPLHENPGAPSGGSGGKRNYGRLLSIGAIALALLVLPVTLSQLNQQQDVRQQAAQPTKAVMPTRVPTPTTTPISINETAPISTSSANR